VDPIGQVIARGEQAAECVCTGELRKEEIIKARTLYPFLRDRRPETYGLLNAARPVSSARQDAPRAAEV
jgi:hypothetical protein